MAEEPKNYTQKDLTNAKQAAHEYVGSPKPFQRPKNVREQIKDDFSAVKESFSTRKKPKDEMRVKNVETDRRTSSMPGAVKNKDFAGSKKDIASQFSDSYAKAGVQPQSNLDRPAKNSQQQKRIERESQERQQLQQQTESQPAQQPQAQQQTGLVRSGSRTEKKRKRLTKRGIARRSVAKVRATAVNVWLWAWGGWAWLWFQVPMALISIIFMTITGILYDLQSGGSTGTDTDSGNSFAVIAGKVFWGIASVFAGLVQYMAAWLGIDLNIFNPGGLFLMTHLVVFFIGMTTLMLCYIQYKMAFINPLGGRGASLKMGMLMLAIVCYGMPILNLFPWFFLWTFAVWTYPK